MMKHTSDGGPMSEERELSSKQQALVRALPNGDSIAEAGRMAGYGTKQAALRAYEGIKRKAPQILERIGYGEEVVLLNLAEMSHAEETKFFPHKAKDGTFRVMKQKVDALDVQLRARIELAKIHDVYPSNRNDRFQVEGTEIQVVITHIGATPDKPQETND